MKSHGALKREILKNRMAEALRNGLEAFPSSMKSMFIDDIVTAFENRLKVLNGTRARVEFFVNSEEVIFSNAEI